MGENTNILSYVDVQQASEYAIPALQWAVGAGVLNGKNGGRLAPTGTATRAEIAAIMQRWCEKHHQVTADKTAGQRKGLT